MFDIGFAELLLIAVLGLVVIGPKRLPEVARTISLWMGRLRRAIGKVKTEMERELKLDEVRRQLHNEEIMHNLEQSAKLKEEPDTECSANNAKHNERETTISPGDKS